MRLLYGGLVAGFLLNVTGIVTVYVLLPQAAAVLIERLGPLPPATASIHALMRLCAGCAVVWVLYATRSRVSTLIGALAISTGVCWVLAYPAVLELWVLLGALDGAALAVAGVGGFVELAAAGYVGWLIAGRSERAAPAQPVA
jgi:hypothetical protein